MAVSTARLVELEKERRRRGDLGPPDKVAVRAPSVLVKLERFGTRYPVVIDMTKGVAMPIVVVVVAALLR